MEVSDEGLARWLRHRVMPKNRANAQQFLAKCGLNANRPLDVISVCKGLSLNDSYWIVDENEEMSFEKSNLYSNNFSRVLAMIAFTGYGSSIRTTFQSCPEFTTNGMLPKCWRRQSGKVYLYKGATSGASNTGNEPYSELYASLIGRAMGANVIPYRISRWSGNLCSVCEIFTSQELSYVPVGRIVKAGGMKAVRAYYEQLGPEYVKALNEMLVFDAIVCNTDRHFGNFGLLVNSRTNEIVAPAPLFDHGNSLFSLAGDENWESEELLQEYVDTLLPCVYDSFIEEAKTVMDSELKAKVRKLLDYKLVRVGNYNYTKKKMEMISSVVNNRARMLLGE